MRKFLHVYISLLIITLLLVNVAIAYDYIIAEDIGQKLNKITIKAKPDFIQSSIGYSTTSSSHMATWVDSEYFTDGNVDGFYFEITGGWNPWGGDYSTPSNLCGLITKNKKSDIIGNNGEFDYIKSSYEIEEKNGIYTTIDLSPENQKSCWLTAGSGLYIGFFGKNGYTMPEIVTHLKAADIACDFPYNTDKNDDGIITIDECYSIDDNKKTNMAYYVPYSSEYIKGSVKCDLPTFIGNPEKIKIDECYETVNGDKINRIKFMFETPYFYKDKDRNKVGRNERIKLAIYDKYYTDNAGEYNIIFYRGASLAERTEGLLEKVIKAIENAFSIGSLENYYNNLKNNVKIALSTTNIANINDIKISSVFFGEVYASEENTYNQKVSMINRFYNYIVKDSVFINMLRIFIALYMSFLGLHFAIGSLRYTTKELMILLLKLTFILSFTTEYGWKLYNDFIVKFFLYGMMSVVITVINIANKVYDPNGYYYIEENWSLSSIFINIDSILMSFFTKTSVTKIFSLFWAHWYGFLVIIIIYILIFYFIYQILNASFPIIISYVQLILALMLGPVFITFYLFKSTEHMFKNWISFLSARVANIIFIVLILVMFTSIIKQQFDLLINFPIYTKSLLQLDFFKYTSFIWFMSLLYRSLNLDSIQIYVIDYDNYKDLGFKGTIFQLLFIFVLILLFGMLIKKIPPIVDSMIKIGNGDGGSMNRLVGNSTFTNTANKQFNKIFGTKDGIIRSVKRIGFNTFGSIINGIGINTKINKMKSNIKNRFSKDQNIRRASLAEAEGLTGKKAVDKIMDSYKEKLGTRYFISNDKINKNYNDFNTEVIKSNMIKFNNTTLYKFKNSNEGKKFNNLLSNQAVVNRLIQNEFGLNLEHGKKGTYDNYLEKYIKTEKNEEYLEKDFLELQDQFNEYKRLGRNLKYIEKGEDLDKFLKSAKGLENKDFIEDKYKKILEERLNKMSDFNYKKRLQYISNLLEEKRKTGENMTEEEEKQFDKNIIELERLESVIEQLKIAQENGFLMSGLDMNKFGISGAADFNSVSGIGDNFLGFNGGANNIAGDIGIKLSTYEDKTKEEKNKLTKKDKFILSVNSRIKEITEKELKQLNIKRKELEESIEIDEKTKEEKKDSEHNKKIKKELEELNNEISSIKNSQEIAIMRMRSVNAKK